MFQVSEKFPDLKKNGKTSHIQDLVKEASLLANTSNTWNRPRCGVPDYPAQKEVHYRGQNRQRRFVLYGGRLDRMDLTYRYSWEYFLEPADWSAYNSIRKDCVSPLTAVNSLDHFSLTRPTVPLIQNSWICPLNQSNGVVYWVLPWFTYQLANQPTPQPKDLRTSSQTILFGRGYSTKTLFYSWNH